jgi:hypothetical protein
MDFQKGSQEVLFHSKSLPKVPVSNIHCSDNCGLRFGKGCLQTIELNYCFLKNGCLSHLSCKCHFIILVLSINLLSRAPPCFGRHVKPFVPAAFAVVSTHQYPLGLRSRLWPVLLMCNP